MGTSVKLSGGRQVWMSAAKTLATACCETREETLVACMSGLVTAPVVRRCCYLQEDDEHEKRSEEKRERMKKEHKKNIEVRTYEVGILQRKGGVLVSCCCFFQH